MLDSTCTILNLCARGGRAEPDGRYQRQLVREGEARAEEHVIQRRRARSVSSRGALRLHELAPQEVVAGDQEGQRRRPAGESRSLTLCPIHELLHYTLNQTLN